MIEEARRLSVFFDADVVITGSASTTGASHLLLQLSELGLIHGVSSRRVRGEVEINIEEKLPSAIEVFDLLADAAIRWVDDPSEQGLEALRGQADPKDVPILGAALEAGCQFLVTFNVKDFRPEQGAIEIATPGELLALIRTHLAGLGEKET